MLAFVYAGQGSQRVGMGKDLYEASTVFRRVMTKVDPSGYYRELCFNGDIDELSRTQNTQPCMVAFAAAMTAMLAAEGIRPQMVCGLSLGEYSALCAAGAFTPKQAVETAALRGRAMAAAVENRECGMAAVLGLGRAEVERVCGEAGNYGVAEAVNYNCPGQIVISGTAQAVTEACELAKAAGAKRCIPLKVSGPFHTSLMKPASDILARHFIVNRPKGLRIPVIFNCTARELSGNETVAEMLQRQVMSSVDFENSVRYMQEKGVDTIIEIGPGKVLSGFIKKIAPQIQLLNVEDVSSLQMTLTALGKTGADTDRSRYTA